MFSPARLRAWRHLRNTSHAMLAHAAGTTPDRVAACENGTEHPDDATVAAWAALFGCRPGQLRSATPHGPGEYWQAANQAMGPMAVQDLAVIADVILRSRARRNNPERAFYEK